MKSLTCFVVTSLAFSALALIALAGPQSSSKEVMAASAPAPMSWNGFYVGVNVGGEFARETDVRTEASPGPFFSTFGPESAVAASLATNQLGRSEDQLIGGAQVGYNFQFTRFLIGAEADIQGTTGDDAAHSHRMSAVPTFPTETMSQSEFVKRELNYIGTIRARVGWMPTDAMVLYATGGFAFADVSSEVRFSQMDVDSSFAAGTNCPYCHPYSARGKFDDTRTGWTAGGGGEWMLFPHWSLKVEYLYFDLGSVSYPVMPLVNPFTGPGGFPIGTTAFSAVNIRASTTFDGHIVRGGLNFHF
jgi:outer membrane immunogenic protein